MSKSTLTRRALVASTAAMPAAAALGLPVAQAGHTGALTLNTALRLNAEPRVGQWVGL